jgi:polar amino acid transport system substrate-binding protein
MVSLTTWTRRRFLQATLLVGGLPATGGCGAFGFGDTLQRIRDEGVIRLGIAGERPYAYLEGGELVGATAAVHRAVFRRIGDIDVRGVQTGFGDLINGLNAGMFDAVAAGMFVTANRCDRVAFSDPVYCAPSGLLVPRGNPDDIRDYASVARSGTTLAVLAGGVEEEYARAVGVSDDLIVPVGSQQDGLEMVADGEAGAFTLTHVSLRAMLDAAGQGAGGGLPGSSAEPVAERVELLDPFVPVVDGEEQLGCGAAAFRKPDTDLRGAFNRELRALRAEGTVLELMSEYGFTTAEMPAPGTTTEQLCRTGGVTRDEIDPSPR